MRLVVAFALLDRRDAVAEVGVHRAAQRHSGDEAAAAYAVEHRVLFGDADWWLRCGERGTHLDDGHIRAGRRPGQHRAHEVWAGHVAVGILVVLVDADAVHSGLRGVDKLVERPVIELSRLVRRGELVEGRVHPD